VGAVIAAHAIVIGIIANSGLKMALAVALGSEHFRRRCVIGLAFMIVAGLAGLWIR
jgi:uncharacterized membrane protein (DUF4010 family)